MNNTKYQILLRVHQSTKLNPAHRFDIENNPGHVMEIRQCIDELIGARYLSEAIGSDVLSITNTGISALEAEKERREKELQEAEKESREQAKQERQQRFDNKIAVANLLMPFITFILGLIAEHYVGIVSFIAGLFH